MSLKALVVGAGRIGASFDGPDDDNVLTHAHAYSVHPAFELAGFVDVDRGKAEVAASVWRCRSFGSLQEAFAARQIDVVSVAAPDDQHYAILKELAGLSPAAIVAEKPVAATVAQGREIELLYRGARPVLSVNYSRRYVPEFQELRRRIAAGEIGRYLAGSGYYGKGIVHNGSHLVDLLRFLIGEVETAQVLSAEPDYDEDDPSVEAVIRFSDGKGFHMQPVSCRAFTVFELDLFFERGRVRILDSGFRIEEQSVESSGTFAGYKNLTAPRSAETGMARAMLFLVDNLADVLSGRGAIPCTVQDALRDLEICASLADSAASA